MKTAFHYLVKAKLIRYINADDINFIEVEEKFENENPILARDDAFNFYQNYIDVLLQSKGLKYQSDKQARKELQSFIDSGTSTKVKFPEKGWEINESAGNGIAIFLVIDTSQEKGHKKDDELLIHGIRDLSRGFNDTDDVIIDLNKEHNLYKQFGYETKNKQREIIYCSQDEWEDGYREDEPFTYTILETPFDWTGYDKPYWWGEPEEVKTVTISESELKWLKRIEMGEGKKVEFKSTLRYHIHLKKTDKIIEHEIAKTIAAFLNFNGGLLVVGVDNDNNILGLENDFNLYSKNHEDKFFQAFKNILENYFGLGIVANLNYDIVSVLGRKIFFVDVFQSRKPIFLNNYGVKEFYVRVGTSSSLYDVEQAVTYIIEKWKN